MFNVQKGNTKGKVRKTRKGAKTSKKSLDKDLARFKTEESKK